MKNMISKFFAIVLLMSFVLISFGQTYEIRTYENAMGYIEVQMRETDGGANLPSNTNGDLIGDIAYAIRWNSALGTDLDFLCASNAYNMRDPSGVVQTDEAGWHYRYYTANNTPFIVPTDWAIGQWETIATYYTTGGSGTNGAFEIAPQFFGVSTLNWFIKDDGVTYHQYEPTPNGSITNYTYPTTVYDFVWVGGDGNNTDKKTRWERDDNWVDECGNITDFPQGLDNVYIPNVSGESGYFPESSGNDNDGWECNNIFIEPLAQVNVPNLEDGENQTYFKINGTLTIEGTLNLTPEGYATVTGTTTINSAEGIVVQATTAGIGSFIDNGTITYGASGTAKVQTYLTNSAGLGNFDIHQVGPTVDLIGGGAGANLSAFNLVNGNTYAYEWDETVGFASGWQNIYDNSYVVNTGAGIGLSTDDGSTNTLEMTGALMTGNISSPSLTFSNNHNELISNPYPSAIDFDGLANDNSGVVENKYWIWNPAGNTYIARAGASGGSQYVQVGQGFFVQTKSGGGTFDFTNTRRSHSNDAFRNTMANILTVKVVGGMASYKDEVIVRFDEDATSGYDIEIEAEKWSSQNNDATQIWAIAEDNTELAINVLPTASLTNGMTSVPMHFSCGYNTEYTISFFDMESFEIGTEIWLEDKQTGAEWVSVNDNPDYTFTATPDDLEDRFVIHFFGTTGVSEFEIENTVDIFSYRQNAFVRNNTNEVIKTVSIYTLAGELLQNNEPANIKLNKFWVSNSIGYYVVRVITNKNVYTEKVFISK